MNFPTSTSFKILSIMQSVHSILVLSCSSEVSKHISACRRVDISCKLLPTRFLSILSQYCVTVKKREIFFHVQFKNKLLTLSERS